MGRLTKPLLAAMTLNCVFLYLTGELIPGVYFEGGLPALLLTGLFITGFNWPLGWLTRLLPNSDSLVFLLAVYLGCNVVLLASSSVFLKDFVVAGTMPLIAASFIFAALNYGFMFLAGSSSRNPQE